jgi:hypothetical protein
MTSGHIFGHGLRAFGGLCAFWVFLNGAAASVRSFETLAMVAPVRRTGRLRDSVGHLRAAQASGQGENSLPSTQSGCWVPCDPETKAQLVGGLQISSRRLVQINTCFHAVVRCSRPTNLEVRWRMLDPSSSPSATTLRSKYSLGQSVGGRFPMALGLFARGCGLRSP